MRWSYKTVHYELKKEGFLGSAFLDEAEVEQSLNEYGQSGWELVSMMETQDGLIAIFKQPLDLEPQMIGSAGIDSYMIDDDGIEELITEEDIIEETPKKKVSSADDMNSIRIE
jgi:hypothetical protein